MRGATNEPHDSQDGSVCCRHPDAWAAAAAFAANSPPLVGVTKSSMNGVKQAAGANGALKVNAVGNRQIKFGSVSCGKLSADLKMALCTGKPGAPGTPGAPGANGTVGSHGDNGGNGSNGSQGGNGSNGHNGSNGAEVEMLRASSALM